MKSIFDKIFAEVPDEIDESWKHIAILGGMAQGAYDNLAIADSFKMAGDKLIEESLSNSEAYELIYPILFSYRHCLELYLKIITKPKKLDHQIQPLVRELDNYIKASYKTNSPKWFLERILEFDEFDSKGTTFRYDDSEIESKNTKDRGEFGIDISHLKNVMEHLQHIFHKMIQNIK